MDAGKLKDLLSGEAWTRVKRLGDAAQVSGAGAIGPSFPSPANSTADVYHGDEDPVSASLLAKSGVGAYLTLINISEVNRLYDQAEDLLINGLGRATQALQVAYHDTLTMLSPELRHKDWSFSARDGKLVLTEGDDKLSSEEKAQLQDAFEANNLEQAVVAVSETIVESISLKRQSTELGGSGHYGWGRFDVSSKNFDEAVDMREYVESVLPGGKYNENPVNREDYGALHTVLSMWAMIDQFVARAKVISET